MTESENLIKEGDFSLVLGGPLYQLFRRTHLSGGALELAWRRIGAIIVIGWLPLLVLSLAEGHAFGWIQIPFINDIEVHVRFLVALPILIAAEWIVHNRLSPAIKQFIKRQIIRDEDLDKFQAAVDSAMRLRNSMVIEIVLIALVYTAGIWLWTSQIAGAATSWHSIRSEFTLAGYWYMFISIPMFQFILIRWYMRFFIWFRLLWSISRLNLNLIATHPDRSGGLGFLGVSTFGFAPILFAQGALLSGLIASRVLFEGQDIMLFKREAGGLIVFFMVFVLSPLVVFLPHLARTKREGLAKYGGLASRYTREFQTRWIEGGETADDELLGTGDIQSLADLGNSFTVIQEMRPVPFGLKDAGRLAFATAAPLIPLGLTVLSLEELITRLAKIIL